MIRILAAIFLMASVLVFNGCSDFATPSASEVISQPFGTGGPFNRGTSKQEVLSDWGNPDQVVSLGVDELGNVRERWVYVGRLPAVPVDYGYVSRTKHLFFEGNSLVRWETLTEDEVIVTDKP